jgi:pimeloyl-ACP methyl ester carboxylesterase
LKRRLDLRQPDAAGLPGEADRDRVRHQAWQTYPMATSVPAREGGSGEPVLLLLHGLGATGDVWRDWFPLLASRWPGRWVAPDLPGHGGAAPLPEYSFQSLAVALADSVRGAGRTVVLGHSLGGVVGLALADGDLGDAVTAVIGLGIKVAWTGEELDRARALAARPVAWFESRDEAAARYLRMSGLVGLVRTDDPMVDAGLVQRDGQWRLAMDPAAFGVGAPDMAGLIAMARTEVTLARGEHDPMNTDDQLAGLGVRTVALSGLGHNAHVQRPDLSIGLLDPYR